MKNFIKITLTTVAIYAFAPMVNAEEINADQRFYYFGAEAGIVEPVQRSFRHVDTNSKITLKRSAMYSGKVGYSFYPQMAFEFSGTYQPTFKLGYQLPEYSPLPSLSGKTKVTSQIYMLNLVYDLKSYEGFTPFVIGGVGIAKLQIKPTSTSFMNTEIFRIKKSNPSCLAWQVGLGVSREVVENLTVDLAGKLQSVHNIKVQYEKINPMTGRFESPNTIKKTIGVWEIGIGFTYKFPTTK
jgi:opacity protein-like surface antigen